MQKFKWLPVVYLDYPNATISVVKPGADDLIEEFGTIGIHINALNRGKGVGTEAMQTALSVARDLGHTEVIFVLDEENTPSRRLVERTGAELIESSPKRRYKLKLDPL